MLQRNFRHFTLEADFMTAASPTEPHQSPPAFKSAFTRRPFSPHGVSLDLHFAFLGIALGFLATGCVEGEVTSDSGTGSESAELSIRVPSEIFDSKGNRFVHVRSARLDAPTEFDVASYPRDAGVERDYSALSVEELAEVLRPRMLRDGEEYVLAEPDLELAAAIKSGTATPRGGRPAIGAAPTTSTAFGDAEGRIPQSVFSPDGRAYQPNNTSYPGRTFLYSASESNCSAVLIGPSTAITSAHCVHTGSRWFNPWPKMYPGVDANDSNWAPYGFYQCSDITIPSGWDGSTVSEDYAVVEFGNARCNNFPGNTVGWLGYWAYSDSWLDGRYAYLFGYPGDKSPYPANWGMGGYVTTSIWYSARLFYSIDSYNGQSGMGVYAFDGSDRYVIGIHRGNYDSNENQARKLDSSVVSFIEAYSRL